MPGGCSTVRIGVTAGASRLPATTEHFCSLPLAPARFARPGLATRPGFFLAIAGRAITLSTQPAFDTKADTPKLFQWGDSFSRQLPAPENFATFEW